jgi:G:T-mismatch repair DNA endonuclease (very short patch repair protein)
MHGCAWHGHDHAEIPDAWAEKVKKNQARARAIGSRLAWERKPRRQLTVWECETKNFDSLKERQRAFLNS